MPSYKLIRKIAKAMVAGLKLSYRGKLQRQQRVVLYELLEDMAIGLTKEGVDEGNSIFASYADILGVLADEIGMPLDPDEWPNHKVLGRDKQSDA